MALTFHPKIGYILMCDFSKGFKEPEMVKERPVIVIATGGRSRSNLVTIACLSTVEPDPILDHHCFVENKYLPKNSLFQGKDSWLKGDMIYAVGFHRLNLIPTGRIKGKRTYFTNRLGREKMKEVYGCVLHGLNLGGLTPHL